MKQRLEQRRELGRAFQLQHEVARAHAALRPEVGGLRLGLGREVTDDLSDRAVSDRLVTALNWDLNLYERTHGASNLSRARAALALRGSPAFGSTECAL